MDSWDLRGGHEQKYGFNVTTFVLEPRCLIRNRTQAAVINIFNLLFFINLTFRIYSTYFFKSSVTILKTVLIYL